MSKAGKNKPVPRISGTDGDAVLYVFHEPKAGVCKVGLSGTPYARLSHAKRHYRGWNGLDTSDLRLYGFVHDGWCEVRNAEILAHAVLERFWWNGEWFRVRPALAYRAAQIGVALAVALDRYPERVEQRIQRILAEQRRVRTERDGRWEV